MLWTLWPPVACLRRNQSHQLYQYWQILLVAFIGIRHEKLVYEFDTPDLKYHFIHLFIYFFIFLESNWTESSCLWIIKLEIKCISIVLKYTFKFRFRISHCPTPLIGFFLFSSTFFYLKMLDKCVKNDRFSGVRNIVWQPGAMIGWSVWEPNLAKPFIVSDWCRVCMWRPETSCSPLCRGRLVMKPIFILL